MVLTLGGDIATLHGKPLSIAILETLQTSSAPSARSNPKDPSTVISAIEDGSVSQLSRAVKHRTGRRFASG